MRDRFSTILIYLNDVDEGGETEFPGMHSPLSQKNSRCLPPRKCFVSFTDFLHRTRCHYHSAKRARSVMEQHEQERRLWRHISSPRRSCEERKEIHPAAMVSVYCKPKVNSSRFSVNFRGIRRLRSAFIFLLWFKLKYLYSSKYSTQWRQATSPSANFWKILWNFADGFVAYPPLWRALPAWIL